MTTKRKTTTKKATTKPRANEVLIKCIIEEDGVMSMDLPEGVHTIKVGYYSLGPELPPRMSFLGGLALLALSLCSIGVIAYVLNGWLTQ